MDRVVDSRASNAAVFIESLWSGIESSAADNRKVPSPRVINKILEKYGIPIPILALAGGVIFFLVALRSVLEQFSAPTTTERADSVPTLSVAITPVAFPGIVTPYGIAALIIVLALSPDARQQWIIGAMVLGIMLVNFVAMLLADRIVRVAGLFLMTAGVVLAVIQVALGLNIIFNALRRLVG